MMDIKYKFKLMLTGFALAFYTAVPAIAEDIEIYTSGSLGAATIQPNVMFIVDTSGSMGPMFPITIKVDYDYNIPYSGSRKSNQIYYTSGGTVGSINTKRDRFFKTANKCDASLQQYDKGVVINTVGPLLKDGFYSDQIAQFRSNAWRTLNTKNNTRRSFSIECKADSGIHGDTSATKPYIADAVGWTSNVPANLADPHPIWSNSANQFTLYDGNYLNYLQGGAIQSTTKMKVAKEAVKAIVDTNNSINICLMRFDGASPYEGGPVIYPCKDVKASRNDFNTRLNNLTAGGSTPLSETMYEALLYFGGKKIDYGDNSNPSNQTGTKQNGKPKYYATPITDTCQKNYIVYLTDGAPQLDYLSTSRRTSPLTNFPVGSCNTDPDPGWAFTLSLFNKDAFSSATSTRDNCLDELAGWALNNDVAERSFPAHDGEQNVVTYTIGFDFATGNQDLKNAERLLRDTATAGGGSFFEAVDKQTLLNAFNAIVAEILAINSTFSSPAVSVNAFNRATNLDDLYFTLFKPAKGEHWVGNFKKFKLAFDATTGNPFIADQTGKAAIDITTGFFLNTSTSFWTTGAADGAETAEGGAASKQTNTRKVYTTTGVYTNVNGVMTPPTTSLKAPANVLDKTNTAVTEALLGIVGSTPIIGATPYRESLIDWATGIDVLDEDNIGGTVNDVTDARRVMGDPLHAEPGLIQYQATGPDANGDGIPDIPDVVSYIATNDGYLHAVNTLDGTEYFSFVPQEMLPKLDDIFQNTGVNGKQYGLDGNVIPWVNDANGDNDLLDVLAGDFAYIYFGMRRGGRDIYSMDVTDRNNPALRWKIEGGVGDYAELGETWSTVNVEKILINSVETTVLIFGGGYDAVQDSVGVRTPDAIGRGVFIVNADTGKLLWRAGIDTDTTADLKLADMKYSIPARVKPLDIDGDGYIDRLYTGDMGGQIWRFDIDNSSTSGISIDGGVFADIAVDGNIADTRRFYYPPDVALIVQEGQPPFISVVAASGYRAHPLNLDIQDRIYMMRDLDVYTSPLSFAPAAYTPITEADLFDTTSNVIGDTSDPVGSAAALVSLTSAAGWYISLEQSDGSFVGEKGLSEPLILGGVAIITTFIPASAGLSASACKANDGTGSLYFVNVTDGTPTYDLSGSITDPASRKETLNRGGIPPSPSVIITDEGTPTLCVGTECKRAGSVNAVEKMYWYEK